MKTSFFSHVTEAPPDIIFQQLIAFGQDPRQDKVNLSVGLYQNEALQTPILKTVKLAEKYLLAEEQTKEYLPISGDPLYLEESGKLIFGNELWNKHRESLCGMQTPGGTGGLKIGADFLKSEVGTTIFIPHPTWPNHKGVFKSCGYTVQEYAYYDLQKKELKIEAILEMLQKAPSKSIVLFHASCHNPTGADPSKEQWEAIARIVQEKQLLPFFDFAYQGLGKGLEEDAYAVRLFLQKEIESVVVFSYSKNFGLYSERVGGIFISTNSPKEAKCAVSKLKICARTNYSNPPRHGAAIVAHILSHPELRKLWVVEVEGMRERIDGLRKDFVETLQSGRTAQDFSSLLSRVGMFCFLDLDELQVLRLKEEYGIYMSSGGRINLAGLNCHNVKRVAESILKVI